MMGSDSPDDKDDISSYARQAAFSEPCIQPTLELWGIGRGLADFKERSKR